MSEYFYFLDFDCTLTKSLDPIVMELNKKYHKNVKPSDIKSWNFREIHDLNDDEIESIFSSELFFENLEFYDGADKFLKLNSENCIIITKGLPNNLCFKRQWLDSKGFLNIPMIGLDLSVEKSYVNMKHEYLPTIFIDDNTSNLLCSNADHKIQFREYGETEWNKDWNGKIITDWNEFIKSEFSGDDFIL